MGVGEGCTIKVLHVTNMWPTDANPAFGIFVQEQVDSLAKLGVQFDVLFIDGRKSSLGYLRSFRPFWRKLRSATYDLIHAHYVLAGFVARAQRKLPVVLTHYGIEALYGWQAPLCWILSRTVEQTIAVSQPIKDRLGLEDIRVIPCGVDLDLFRPMDRDEARRELGLPLDRKFVLFVGLPRPEKRFDVVEGALARLKEDRLPVDLVTIQGQYEREQIHLFMYD
jgi:glycosyltransferase involved in cell wall biosynthesis